MSKALDEIDSIRDKAGFLPGPGVLSVVAINLLLSDLSPPFNCWRVTFGRLWTWSWRRSCRPWRRGSEAAGGGGIRDPL